jgi:hypothetical protein
VLLRRAAQDGHTWLPRSVLEAASVPWQQDAARGALVALTCDGVEGLALDEVSTAEEALADEIGGLAAEGRLAVAYGRPQSDVAQVITDVEGRSLTDLAEALQAVPDDARVVLAGDPDTLRGLGPGAVLRDVVASHVTPVHDTRKSPEGALGVVLAGLRRGELVQPDPADRGVVVVSCADDAEVVHRVGQLVSTSLPRAFDVEGSEVVVLSPLRRGLAGTSSIAEQTAAEVLTVHEVAASGRTWPAVVVCIPAEAAGVLSRALLVSAFLAAERHVSVVTAAGSDLALAVREVPHRPERRTRLASLLTA